MITPSALRIGNLILDHKRRVRTVAYVGETIGLHNEGGGTNKYQKNPIWSGEITKLRGIKLTSEWLEKFGWKWETTEKNHMHKETPTGLVVTFYFQKGVLNELQFYDSEFWEHASHRHIPRFVHQLQNLYFALTGNELEICP